MTVLSLSVPGTITLRQRLMKNCVQRKFERDFCTRNTWCAAGVETMSIGLPITYWYEDMMPMVFACRRGHQPGANKTMLQVAVGLVGDTRTARFGDLDSILFCRFGLFSSLLGSIRGL